MTRNQYLDEKRRTSFRAQLGTALDSCAKLALGGSRADLRLRADDDLWPVEADEGQIVQVVQNLVLNAAQAMSDGGTVDIECRNVQIDGMGQPDGRGQARYVQVSVTDSGAGIPQEHLGRIEVRSSPGRVLVMDDERLIREAAFELLPAIGHGVALAAEGGEAVGLYLAAREAGEPFRAVILDLTVPDGMGGAEALRRIREYDPDVRAIVSSGYSDDDAIARHAELGFKAFLRKPYRLDELREALNRVLAP